MRYSLALAEKPWLKISSSPSDDKCQGHDFASIDYGADAQTVLLIMMRHQGVETPQTWTQQAR